MPGYQPTPLIDLASTARTLGVAAVHMKDESDRFGLPAFKILGASWAIDRTVQAEPGVRMLIAATAGNHGRAVARAATSRGLTSRIYIPTPTSEARAELIRGEGAQVVRVDGAYESAVAIAKVAGAEPGCATIADVAYEAADGPPAWVIEGYATLFAEAANQAPEPFDLIIVPVGAGSLAAAAVRFAAHQFSATTVVGVEPYTAACVTAALDRCVPTVVLNPGTSMAGLNCALVSEVAWPTLRDGLCGCVTVSDAKVDLAIAELASLGLTVGECGAAPLVALRALVTDPRYASVRDEVKLGPTTRVLLVATEGISQ
jgi:diaminopropionate ammonia-lyase